MTNTRTKTHRWQRILLVASLALNLAVAGVFVGIALQGGPKDRMQRIDLTVGPLTRAMDEDRRLALRTAVRDSGEFRPMDRDALRADMLTLVDELRADEFNADAFRENLLRQRTRLQSGQDVVLSAILDEISDMSMEERAAFADRFLEQLRNTQRPPPSRGENPRGARSGG